MPQAEQTYANHVRRDITFMAAALILAINVIFVLIRAIRIDLVHFRPWTILQVAVSIALLIVAAKARFNAVKVQDRVIRLEERLRYAAILSPDLAARSAALTIPQIVALRFASDTELPTLLQRTLAESLTSKQVKQAVAKWRPDDLRV
jgi:uncharacterized membrane protein YraQ (UPF0718 family)